MTKKIAIVRCTLEQRAVEALRKTGRRTAALGVHEKSDTITIAVAPIIDTYPPIILSLTPDDANGLIHDVGQLISEIQS